MTALRKRALLLHLRRNLVAYLALFVALGGTATAAANFVIPSNSVGSTQVIDHSLRRIDLAGSALLRGPRGLRGPVGAKGERGSQGPAGLAAGKPVLSVTSVMVRMGGLTGTAARAAATCPADSSVVGGGYLIPENARPDLDIRISESRATPVTDDPAPGPPPNSWVVYAYVKNASPIRGVDALPSVYVIARCARIETAP